MNDGQIRPLALGVVWRGAEILVFEGYDHVKDETFYRLLGGGIEFGERGHEIVLLYEAALADHSFYELETLQVREETETLPAYWMPLRSFREGGPPLYPDGLLECLTGQMA